MQQKGRREAAFLFGVVCRSFLLDFRNRARLNPPFQLAGVPTAMGVWGLEQTHRWKAVGSRSEGFLGRLEASKEIVLGIVDHEFRLLEDEPRAQF